VICMSKAYSSSCVLFSACIAIVWTDLAVSSACASRSLGHTHWRRCISLLEAHLTRKRLILRKHVAIASYWNTTYGTLSVCLYTRRDSMVSLRVYSIADHLSVVRIHTQITPLCSDIFVPIQINSLYHTVTILSSQRGMLYHRL
jgi:hypothetical protein